VASVARLSTYVAAGDQFILRILDDFVNLLDGAVDFRALAANNNSVKRVAARLLPKFDRQRLFLADDPAFSPTIAECHFGSTVMVSLLTSAASRAIFITSAATSSSCLPFSTGFDDAFGEAGSYTRRTDDCSAVSGGKKTETLLASWNCLILQEQSLGIRGKPEADSVHFFPFLAPCRMRWISQSISSPRTAPISLPMSSET
jgi:hypothetical protein